MPIFALANAGIRISGNDVGQSVAVAIVAGLVLGKPIGVLILSGVAVRLGLATRPPELNWSLGGRQSLDWDRFHDVAVHCRLGIHPRIVRRRQNRNSNRVCRLGRSRPSDADLADF